MLQKKHKDDLKLFEKQQDKLSKIPMMHDTIRKQEEVITKLDKVMTRTLKESEEIYESKTMLQDFKNENEELHQQCILMARGTQDEEQHMNSVKEDVINMKKVMETIKLQLKEVQSELKL